MKLKYLFIISFFLWEGCSSKSTTDVVKIAVHTESEGQMSDYFQKAKVVILETNDQALISSVEKVILAPERIFILGNYLKNVFVFDTTGKHISTIESAGRGPEEYILIKDITVDYNKKELILLACIPLKLMFFDFDGKLKQKYEFPDGAYFYNIVVDKNQLLARYRPYGDSIVSMGIWDVENKRFESQKETEMVMKWKCPIVIQGSHMSKGEQLNCTMDFDRNLYTYTNGILKPRYELDFGRDNFVYASIKEMKSDEFVGKTFVGNYVFRLQQVKETSDYIFYNTNNGKGLGVIDKQSNESVLYRKMKDEQLQLTINKMKPVEDLENEWMGCVFPVSSLQKMMGNFDNLSPTTNEWIKKINTLEEDANPVLILYPCK